MADELYRKLSRRDVVKAGAFLAVASPLLVACAREDAPPEAPAAEATPDEAAEEEVPEVEGVPEVARNRTLFLRWGGQEGRFIDHELWNGYAVGANHQNGLGIFYEPLAYYSAFADEMIPWLAEDWEYSADLTELTITTRSGITWSDGEPFSAEDVAYTFNTLRDLGPQVRWGTDVQQFVEEAEAVSDT